MNINIVTNGGDYIIDPIERIDQLMQERGWSNYRLCLESGLSTSTIANIHRRNTVPSIPTLEAICNAFGITLSQFFQEESCFVALTEEQKNFFDKWVTLTSNQKKLLAELVNEMK